VNLDLPFDLPLPDVADAAPPYDVTGLGQVFTPDVVVEAMLALRRRRGRTLEPSAGNGAFSRRIPDCVAVEADARHAPPGAIVTDFFAYPESERFQTVIGNPPYVRFQDIAPATRRRLGSRLFDGRSNLYLFFIEKAVRHLEPGGELIFITPRDFLKTTSAVALNRWLYARGSFTDLVDLGDTRVFSGAMPNCLIWRFERDDFSRRCRYAALPRRSALAPALNTLQWEERLFQEVSGHLHFARDSHARRLGELFSVRVGAVSGADEVYTDPRGNREFVCSQTAASGETRRMIWQAPGGSGPHPALLPHKARLMARRIRAFDESNWWQWGRAYPETEAPRIYVNGRTRRERPFFLHPCPHYDGAILALFPHDPAADLVELCRQLNALDWAGLGFVCDGRFLFTQRSLENAPLPASFGAPASPTV
jgi:adenine-specific DNA-methyltransferase